MAYVRAQALFSADILERRLVWAGWPQGCRPFGLDAFPMMEGSHACACVPRAGTTGEERAVRSPALSGSADADTIIRFGTGSLSAGFQASTAGGLSRMASQVVIGAGPVGWTAASMLADAGHDVSRDHSQQTARVIR